MTDKELSEEEKMHKKLAINLFNATWGLMDKKDRTKEEDDEMIHSAHASRFHWGKVGNHIHFERGEWQISRVYSVLKMVEPAIYHGQRCLDICLENKIGDFDIAFAYESLARAYAIKDEKDKVGEYKKLAKEAGEKIAKKEDKDYFFGELNNI
ncbi:MAG: hypothetical protein ACTSO7_05395 [Candidatus Heimdallarchaeota archaeon]